MGLITLKCSNCGDNMHIDESKDVAFCSSCGAKNLITQEVVNVNNIINNTHQTTQHIHKTIIGKEQSEAEDYIRNGNVFISLKDWEKAAVAFEKAVELNPADYNAWLGLALATSKDLTDPEDYSHIEYFNKAFTVATSEQKQDFLQIYNPRYKELEKIRKFGIVDGVVTHYIGNETEVEIPEGVTAIGDKAFLKNENITRIAIPQGVKSIGFQALAHCSNLEKVLIPDTIRVIGESAFGSCEKLTELNIPNGVTAIQKNAFSRCTSLKNIILPDSLTQINDYLFEYCSNLTNVVIPYTVTKLGSCAFANCNKIDELVIGDNVEKLERYCFFGWTEQQTISVNKKQSKNWDKKWQSYCKAKIVKR